MTDQLDLTRVALEQAARAYTVAVTAHAEAVLTQFAPLAADVFGPLEDEMDLKAAGEALRERARIAYQERRLA